MGKRELIDTGTAKRFVRRDEKGRISEVTIVRPKKGPSSVSLKAIRQAVRTLDATRKSK
jgi:hypothetical protein